jgi:hypothetical protein
MRVAPRHLIAVLATAASFIAPGAAPAGASVPCFGAAARDAEHPCSNPQLLHAVAPRPIAALLETDAPCDPFDRAWPISVCYFGVPAIQAPASVAIVGDSHATHWRPAVSVLARAKGWRGASLARTSCPFTLGASATLPPRLRRSCIRHNRAIPGWFARHPGIQTVFVAANAGSRVVAKGALNSFESTIEGDVAALKSLPATVKHVIVIRDAVKSTYLTPACISRAIRSGRSPGRACSVPAGRVLRADPLVRAARRIGTRVQVIDLKRFQCSHRRCFPVVGGVLVHQDIGHLTRLFATTLGPYLTRAYDRLSEHWRKPAAVAAAQPACFGAAARDREHPCSNPDLRYSVVPRPDVALLENDSPCAPEGDTGVLLLCSFGAPAADAVETTALIGDSHATHWRPALDLVARLKGWRVMNMTRTSCPFSAAPPDKGRTLRRQCAQRNRLAVQWLSAHPEVRTVFIAGNAAVRVYRSSKGRRYGRALAGYAATLRSLPDSVKHVVVIRDSVKAKSGTLDCVRRAIAAHERPGITCALRRSQLSRRDPAVGAASAIAAPHGDVIDLTRFQCSARFCFPVVGGVLVHKDVDHITRTFARSLAPYLLRDFDRLSAAWG